MSCAVTLPSNSIFFAWQLIKLAQKQKTFQKKIILLRKTLNTQKTLATAEQHPLNHSQHTGTEEARFAQASTTHIFFKMSSVDVS